MFGGDGHGVAWWRADGQGPARYRNTLPLWSDVNVNELADYVEATLIVASTRTASAAMPVALPNTPPFVAGGLALAHNGEIVNFHGPVAEGLRAELSVAGRASLRGNTDTEMLVALLAETPRAHSLAVRVEALLTTLRRHVQTARTSATLNLLVADGQTLVVVRTAVEAEPPSLYRSTRADGSVWIASEAYDDGAPWSLVEPNRVEAHPRVAIH